MLINAFNAVCAGSNGNIAGVAPESGFTYSWQITGGTITSATTGEAIAFQAGASGSVVLTVTSSNSCSSQTPATITIPVGVAPTQSTISAQSTVHAGATGTASQPTLTPLVTPVKAMDVVELRRAIDALRYAVNLPPVFQSTPAPSGVIYATHFTALINALSPARTALGRAPFVYVNNVPLPATGGPILAEQVRQLREALR